MPSQYIYQHNITSMKASLMRPPAIAEIYHQKLTYENHLKKLSQIRQDRRHQLQLDHSRQAQLHSIKQGKSKSFAHKFNEQNLQINQSNVKFLVKLQRVRPFARTSPASSDRFSKDPTFLNPITKRKIIETEKENSRLFFKMKSVSSTLSKERMMSDYAKAQRIKQRITKYATDNNQVALKSQKYVNHHPTSASRKSSQQGSCDRLKRNLVSHYKKEDIIRNKISNTEHRIFKSKRQRPLPSLQVREQDGHQVEGKDTIFTTQPEKRRAITTRTRV